MPVRATSEVRTFADYSIVVGERMLCHRGEPVALAPRVVETLIAFAESPERVISKAELIDRIWPEGNVEDGNLTQNIYMLRRMFAEHRSGVRIENVPKRGYRLVCDAGSADRPSAPHTTVVSGVTLPAYAVPATCALLVLIAVLAAVAGGARRSAAAGTNRVLGGVALTQYMLGKYDLNRGTLPALRASVEHFDRVVATAPASALGFAGLADAETSLTFYTADGARRAELAARALDFARRAVAADPSSSEAFAALGATTLYVDRDAVAAAGAFETALRDDPRNFDALMWYGTSLMNRGRVDDARRLFERALSIDATVPGAAVSLAWADFLAHDYRSAIAVATHLLRDRATATLARVTLANAEVALGRDEAALRDIAVLERTAETTTQGAALEAQLLARRGDRNAARAALARAEAAAGAGRVATWDALAIAAACARVGEPNDAFVWLDHVGGPERAQLAHDPRFDILRNDTRFAAWLRV